MKNNIIETIIGALVLLVAIGFILLAYKKADIGKHTNSYAIKAKFENIDGVTIGSDVRIGGIKVGIVSNMLLDPNTYLANLQLDINNEIKLPKDSSAQISSDGLLGNKFVTIQPGTEDNLLKNDDEIKYTQSAVNLETLLGKFMFSGSANNKQDESSTTSETK